MNPLRNQGWRIALVASGIAMFAGAPRHPGSDGTDPMRQELAVMTSHPDWVPAHTLVMLSTILLAAGLLMAHRKDAWPGVRTALGVAAVAVAVYVIETAFHLAAVVDNHALLHGGPAPVATTHIWLAAVLYPITGPALAYLGVRQLAAWPGARRFLGVPAVIGGLAHATAVPLTLIFPAAEWSPLFAIAGMMLGAYALVTGLAGAPRPVPVGSERSPVPV